MDAFSQILSRWGNETVKIITDNSRRAGQVATGNTLKALRSDSTDTRVTVSGPAHIYVLEDGRGPYKGGEKANLPSKIEAWMRAKGVRPFEGKTIKQTAFAISRSMNKRGSVLFRQGGRKDIITPAISDDRVDQLTAAVAAVATGKTLKVIDDGLQ